jgi:hypothetical protein
VTGFLDLKNLEYLDLNLNTLNNSIFQAIRMMTFLKALNLHGCKLDGRIPLAQGKVNNSYSFISFIILIASMLI